MFVYWNSLVTIHNEYSLSTFMHKAFIDKIIYRGSHRGSKENEFLLGDFVKNGIDDLSNQDLQLLELFLEEQDPDIFNWLATKKNIPEKYISLVCGILSFNSLR